MKIVIHKAATTLSRPVAHRLAELMARDPDLDALPVDMPEAEAGKVRLAVFFEHEPPLSALAKLRRLTADAGGPARARFDVEGLPPTNWVAESLGGLPPVRAGRFLVHGGHDRDARRPNDLAIEIEAGLAFGTGHHGTTVGCLLAIGDVLKRRHIVNAADIGTGSGVLAIALAKAAKVPVVATDNDPVAVAVAAANCRANGTGGRVRTAVAAATDHRLYRVFGPLDLIVANILAEPLARMAPSIRRVAAPGASLILSGLLPHQRRRIVATYRNTGFRLAGDRVVDGWLTLTFRRP